MHLYHKTAPFLKSANGGLRGALQLPGSVRVLRVFVGVLFVWVAAWLSVVSPGLRSFARPSVAPPSCAQLRPHVLVYNRVVKTGSTSFLDLLKRLGRLNGFEVRPPALLPGTVRPHAVWRSSAEARAAIEDALRSPVRSAIASHFNFPELADDPRVVFINVVREPVSQFTSLWYFNQWSDPSTRSLNKTLDEYVAQQDASAVSLYSSQVLFFCGIETGGAGASGLCPGHHLGATTPEGMDVVLARAFENVEAHFALVGVTERLAEFVELLEVTLPEFFAGALRTYKSIDKHANIGSDGKRYTFVPPSNTTRAALARGLSHDASLYAFVRSSFEARFARCVTRGNTA